MPRCAHCSEAQWAIFCFAHGLCGFLFVANGKSAGTAIKGLQRQSQAGSRATRCRADAEVAPKPSFGCRGRVNGVPLNDIFVQIPFLTSRVELCGPLSWSSLNFWAERNSPAALGASRRRASKACRCPLQLSAARQLIVCQNQGLGASMWLSFWFAVQTTKRVTPKSIETDSEACRGTKSTAIGTSRRLIPVLQCSNRVSSFSTGANCIWFIHSSKIPDPSCRDWQPFVIVQI